jgi:hypothetical protein
LPEEHDHGRKEGEGIKELKGVVFIDRRAHVGGHVWMIAQSGDQAFRKSDIE